MTPTDTPKPRLPGWDGGVWTTREPWRFVIDASACIGNFFLNEVEGFLRSHFDISTERKHRV